MNTAGYPECMQALISEFSKMPGVGVRTAERFAFYVLGAEKSDAARLAESILRVNETIRYCRVCFNLSQSEECHICRDATRNHEILCVVEDPKDIIALEKAGAHKGLYHVLLGSLSPLDGVGPQDLKIEELVARIKSGKVKEVVLALTSDTEGEATAIYLTKVIKPLKIYLTRLAQGIPLGSELEFTDKATLLKAVEARREL